MATQLTKSNSPATIIKELAPAKYEDANFAMDLLEVASELPSATVPTLAKALAKAYLVQQLNEQAGRKGLGKEELKELLEEELEKAEATRSKGSGTKKDPRYLDEYFRGEPLAPDWDELKRGDLPEMVIKSSTLAFANKKVTTETVEGKPKTSLVIRRIRSIREIQNVTLKERLLPPDVFALKLAQKQLLGAFPKKAVSIPKTLIVLLDDSGSMNQDYKIALIIKIFEALFKPILKGDLRLLVAPFEHNLGAFMEISNSVQIENFKNTITAGSGGWTYLNHFLPGLIENIKKGEVNKLPVPTDTQVLIINDGEDNPNMTQSDIPVNAIALAHHPNTELRELCRNSGGEYMLLRQ